ncbi:Golgi CORVET complex core vacuolar protein 8-domain-containing protein [Protomyces lactucae-debilis]|uniref:Golgi CORVET complex core vacuolar protein 8-domain-containing protein n=1 Tax=Protomyces lactucae-debilis TaxID=2754530 RepID=A0A1Y2F8V9_PROLT|nr:Golgi CORVET complex core vacuolar protein 8-domain-containing protein [Protomyces lactucae-debilis]ORY80331.1 Golgi CORVET complex core vacuolar protein 8-domain-containing protein [Protomyces lactucae-debilis]
MSHDEEEAYERALREVLGDSLDEATSNAWQAAEASQDDASSDASLRIVPAIALDDVWEDSHQSQTRRSSVLSLSTADESLSPRDSDSILSLGDSSASVTESPGASTHRSYLGPLRSKRYEGLRSSLLSPALAGPRPRTAHSRSSSVLSMLNLQEITDDQAKDLKPRDTLRWTRLKRISDHLYSPAGRKAFGIPQCLTVSGMLAFGTSKGLILVFDYKQTCTHVIGNGTRAAEAGPVTAIALSADHTFIVGAYSDGSIMSWDLARPATPAKEILPIRMQDLPAKQGHLMNTHITHISFIGARHSLFLSADVTGMVFCHSFHRRKIVSNVDSMRILGRYPTLPGTSPLKPSTSLSAAVLPIGTVAHFSDVLGLAALLTPYKLVIVSTTPTARTQFKLPRPSGAYAESEQISGCAAWFPCVSSTRDAQVGTCPLLAVAWSRRLFVFAISGGVPQEESDSIVPIVVEEAGQFQSQESIVAMRWYAKDILCLLTTSNQMQLLDTVDFRLVGHADLLGKHILCQDLRTAQLQYYFEQREAEYVNQSFADDYSSSFTTYKGKLFLLGHSEVSVGSVLTWKDRVQAFVAQGLFVEALNLLEAYYAGLVDLRVVALPSAQQPRQEMVSSLCYTILPKMLEQIDQLQSAALTELLQAIFDLCLALDSTDFLFDQVFEACNIQKHSFLQVLATAVLDDRIRQVPPEIVQELVSEFVAQNLHTRLEDILCHLEPSSLDPNQLTQLCKQNLLMDALAYVWNAALADYVTPLVEFVELIKSVLQATSTTSDASARAQSLANLGANTVNAVKVFSYLSLTLTGRSFPRGIALAKMEADAARSAIYEFLFSGVTIAWPPGSSRWILTNLSTPEPFFPYLKLLLHFDCPTFLACLDEVFEDAYLNEGPDDERPRSATTSRTITRQFIINILLDISSSFSQEDMLSLCMFIARNVPKYPQFILLSGSVLQRILEGLCDYQDDEVADDCQLAVESLLSIFKPAHMHDLVPRLTRVGFFRVLKSYFRAEGDAVGLLQAYLRDRGSEVQVFGCIEELIGPASKVDAAAQQSVQVAIVEHALAIARVDAPTFAKTMDRCRPALHHSIATALDGEEALLFRYLQPVIRFEPTKDSIPEWIDAVLLVKVVELLCRFDRGCIPVFLERPGVLTLVPAERLIGILEQHDEVEGLVRLMSISGQRTLALKRILRHLDDLLDTLTSHSHSVDVPGTMTSMKRYIEIASVLCAEEVHVSLNDGSNKAEAMWVTLLTATLNLTQKARNSLGPLASKKSIAKELVALNSLLRNAVGTLLIAASQHSAESGPDLFVQIIRKFLEQILSTDSTSGARKDIYLLLSDVFDEHILGGQLLLLAEDILQGTLATQFAAQSAKRLQGWRVSKMTCGLCERAVHSPVVVRQAFRTQQAEAACSLEARRAARSERVLQRHGVSIEKAKGKSRQEAPAQVEEEEPLPDMTHILAHACGHVSHEACVKLSRVGQELSAIGCVVCVRRREAETQARRVMEEEQGRALVLP